MTFAATLAGLVLSATLTAGGYGYNYSNEATPKGEAYVNITAKGELPPMEVTIKGDGQTIKKSIKGLKNGESYRIDWIQSTPRASYTMTLSGQGIEGSTSFEVVKASGEKQGSGPGRITPKCTREDIVDHNTAKFQIAFDVKSYGLTVYDTSGKPAFVKRGGADYSAGDIMEFTWNDVGGVFMVEIKAVGLQGQTGAYRLVPWQVSIPHVDVIFDSGKAVIKEGEAPKVDRAFDAAVKELAALERINQAVGDNIKAQLYIIGYTDTVGPAGKNQKLSRGRAKAIAQYFKKKGIWCEIYYAGMGENGLAVKTPDNTDEARNRRAQYILTVNRPPPGGAIPASWTKMAGARPRPKNVKIPDTTSLSSPSGAAAAAEAGSAGSGSDSSGDAGSSGGGEPSDTAEETNEVGGGGDESEGSWEDSLSDQERPPAIEEEPGASKKGCSIGAGSSGGALGLAMLVGLVGLQRRRRLRVR